MAARNDHEEMTKVAGTRFRRMLGGLIAVAAIGLVSPAHPTRAGDDDDSGHGYRVHGEAPETLLAKGKAVSVVVTKNGRPYVRKVRSLAKFNEVKAAEDVIATAATAPMKAAEWPPYDPSWGSTATDPGSSSQWVLPNTTIDEAWQYGTGAASSTSRVTVAVLDTGVYAGHPDLQGQVMSGYNSQTGVSGASSDPHGHGTHVAGIVAARVANGAGVKGAAPGARILPVTVLDSTGSGTDADVANGIIWAVDHGAGVINLSLGGAGEAPAMLPALQYAADRGVVVIAAAGNEAANGNPVIYPAAYTNVIAVGASTSGGALASYSERQSYVDVTAPGSSIYSTLRTGGYGSMSGTSMATPYVAGVAALLKSRASLSPSAVMSVLQKTAGGSIGTGSGAGIVNPLKALQSLGVSAFATTTTTTVAPTTTTTTLAPTTTSTTLAPATTVAPPPPTTAAPALAPTPTTARPVATKFISLPRARVIDTRYRRPVRVGTNTIRIYLGTKYGIPANALTVRLRVIVIRPSRGGYLTAWPTGQPKPLRPNGRYTAYRYTYLYVDVARGKGGYVDVHTTTAAHMAIDVIGATVPA